MHKNAYGKNQHHFREKTTTIPARRSKASGEVIGRRSVLRRAWSRPQRAGGARSKERLHKFLDGRTN